MIVMIATLALDNNDCYIRSGEQGPLHSLWVAMIATLALENKDPLQSFWIILAMATNDCYTRSG